MSEWTQLFRELEKRESEILHREWGWLIGDSCRPLVVTIFGDVFLENEQGVFWLNTGTGELTIVAKDKEEFFDKLANDQMRNDWLLVALAQQLKEMIGVPSVENCYSYTIFPVFSEGSYSASNFYLLPFEEHIGVTGSLHKQIHNVSNGESIKFKVIK